MAQSPKLKRISVRDVTYSYAVDWKPMKEASIPGRVLPPLCSVQSVWEAHQASYPVNIGALNSGVKRPLLHIIESSWSVMEHGDAREG